MSTISDDITRLRREVDALRRSRQDQQRARQESVAELKTAVAETKTAVAETLSGFRDSLAQMAASAQAARGDFAKGVKAWARETCAGFRKARQKMAEESRANRHADHLRAEVSEIRSQVDSMVSRFQSTRCEAAAHERTAREGFIAELKSAVTKVQGGIRDELNAAHDAWFGPAPAPPQPTEKKRAAGETNKPAADSAKPAAETAKRATETTEPTRSKKKRQNP